jgi:hypothetical protein
MLQKRGLPAVSLFQGKIPYLLAKRRSAMKRPAITAVVAFLTWMPVMVQAGQNGGAAATQDNGSETRKVSAKPISLTGMVGTDGKTLTADKDSRIWMVSNPEALNRIDGRHVKIRALLNVAQGQIRIVSVSALAERTGTNYSDAAFRR